MKNSRARTTVARVRVTSVARPKPSITEVRNNIELPTAWSPVLPRKISSPMVTSASVTCLRLWEAGLCYCITTGYSLGMTWNATAALVTALTDVSKAFYWALSQ